MVLRVDPAQSRVHWTLGSTLHTVHGTFTVKSGTVQLDGATGRASGEIVVDARSGQSGNDGRDKKMHKEIIESAKYNEIAFRPDHVEGKVPAQGGVTAQVHGMFLLHGAEHEITVPVEADLAGDHWKGTGKFTVPYIAWGLKSPNNFFLKADPAVQVELELAGAVERSDVAAGTGSPR
jgi:polyisoprenoid-binding protein YceI